MHIHLVYFRLEVNVRARIRARVRTGFRVKDARAPTFQHAGFDLTILEPTCYHVVSLGCIRMHSAFINRRSVWVRVCVWD